MTVGELLVATFTAARAADQELAKRWLSVAGGIHGFLPNSLITVTVQRLGEVDAVCRAVERELVVHPLADGELDLRHHYCMMISEV
jgi:hypothetical protein